MEFVRVQSAVIAPEFISSLASAPRPTAQPRFYRGVRIHRVSVCCQSAILLQHPQITLSPLTLTAFVR